jgi:microcystin-dependent protein
MSEPFLGEVRLFSFGSAPRGWAQCNGQLLPINQNQALFSLLGTMYGGNGQTTFALPDLRGRYATHFKNGFNTQGQSGGTEAHTLSMNEMPQHVHFVSASSEDGNTVVPTGALLAGFANGYRGFNNPRAIGASTIGNVGGSQPHENMSPFIVVNFCIALLGIFPSAN